LRFFFEKQSACGTKPGAGTTMNTFVRILQDAFGKRLHGEPHFLQEAYPAVEILFLSGKLQNDNSLAFGENSCLEDIEDQIVFLLQLVNDRLLDDVRRIANDDFLRIHRPKMENVQVRGMLRDGFCNVKSKLCSDK